MKSTPSTPPTTYVNRNPRIGPYLRARGASAALQSFMRDRAARSVLAWDAECSLAVRTQMQGWTPAMELEWRGHVDGLRVRLGLQGGRK